MDRYLALIGALDGPTRRFVSQCRLHERARRLLRSAAIISLAVASAIAVYFSFLQAGSVVVTSEPPGAEVRAGREIVGRTPLCWIAAPGHHVLTFALARHAPIDLHVTVRAGTSIALRAALTPLFGRVQLDSEPAGATVRMAGRDVSDIPHVGQHNPEPR
jgi:hypothetical protein